LRVFPNPFSRGLRATVSGVTENSRVLFSVYTISGKRVKTVIPVQLNSTTYGAFWDATGNANEKVATGIYLFRASVNGKVLEKKILGVK
jgi:flagellar hook assembly protein FlgD